MFHRNLASLVTTFIVKQNHCQLSLTNATYYPIYSTLQSRNSVHHLGRCVTTLSPAKIKELLCANEIHLGASELSLPAQINSIECNQLASNSPIEDRIRISKLKLPGEDEPALILGVFDGHGGGTTANIICRRLFGYIAVALHPRPQELCLSSFEVNDIIEDLHNSPTRRKLEDDKVKVVELNLLSEFKNDLCQHDRNDIASSLRASFQRCDDDLSEEIQKNLISKSSLTSDTLGHYLSAAVSGCCAIVTLIHKGVAYVASVGDCRAVLGIKSQPNGNGNEKTPSQSLKALELNDEHNCDNINEIRRLSASHPKSEQNTIVRHNRLLGHLMPFRAFGDYNYKWPAEIIKACGITRAFGPGVIPSSYETPPYLIAEPEVKTLPLDDIVSMFENNGSNGISEPNTSQDRFLVIATDGLWELFESSRDVVEAIVDHSNNASQRQDEEVDEGDDEYYDTNCATYMLRSALQSGPYQDISLDKERLRKLHHIRLESTLTLPKSVVRNFRDDISIIIIRLN